MLEKMLIKSKPRHPIVGPITDFSCQNVFYMPQKLSKRPFSAPTTARRQSVPVRKFAVPAKRKPQRVLQGSKQEAKIISKVNNYYLCMD
jgi:hypothetical protein